VGIDTCSAKSISCDIKDFLNVNLVSGCEVEYQLRGVGGVSKAAGKGVMVVYAKDREGKMKAIIEPKGIYLKNPSAAFRILGQQNMKVNGVTLIQDYDGRRQWSRYPEMQKEWRESTSRRRMRNPVVENIQV
jgi:hypothetical protein